MPQCVQLFVVRGDKETSDLCQMGGEKLGHSLGCSVSLSETLTASPRCLTGNQSLGTHEDQDYQSLSCFNVLC